MMTKLIKGADGKVRSHSIGVEALERAPKGKDARVTSERKPVQYGQPEPSRSQVPDGHQEPSTLLNKFRIYTPKQPQSIYTISMTKYVLRPNINVFKHFNGYEWFTIGFSGTEMALVKASQHANDALRLATKHHSCYNGVTSANLIRHIKSHVPVQYRKHARHFRALMVKPSFIVFDLSKPY